jgi:hypothetical protein
MTPHCILPQTTRDDIVAVGGACPGMATTAAATCSPVPSHIKILRSGVTATLLVQSGAELLENNKKESPLYAAYATGTTMAMLQVCARALPSLPRVVSLAPPECMKNGGL